MAHLNNKSFERCCRVSSKINGYVDIMIFEQAEKRKLWRIMKNFNIIIDTNVIKIKIFLIKNFIAKDGLNMHNFNRGVLNWEEKKEKNIGSMFENLKK